MPTARMALLHLLQVDFYFCTMASSHLAGASTNKTSLDPTRDCRGRLVRRICWLYYFGA